MACQINDAFTFDVYDLLLKDTSETAKESARKVYDYLKTFVHVFSEDDVLGAATLFQENYQDTKGVSFMTDDLVGWFKEFEALQEQPAITIGPDKKEAKPYLVPAPEVDPETGLITVNHSADQINWKTRNFSSILSDHYKSMEGFGLTMLSKFRKDFYKNVFVDSERGIIYDTEADGTTSQSKINATIEAYRSQLAERLLQEQETLQEILQSSVKAELLADQFRQDLYSDYVIYQNLPALINVCFNGSIGYDRDNKQFALSTELSVRQGSIGESYEDGMSSLHNLTRLHLMTTPIMERVMTDDRLISYREVPNKFLNESAVKAVSEDFDFGATDPTIADLERAFREKDWHPVKAAIYNKFFNPDPVELIKADGTTTQYYSFQAIINSPTADLATKQRAQELLDSFASTFKNIRRYQFLHVVGDTVEMTTGNTATRNLIKETMDRESEGVDNRSFKIGQYEGRNVNGQAVRTITFAVGDNNLTFPIIVDQSSIRVDTKSPNLPVNPDMYTYTHILKQLGFNLGHRSKEVVDNFVSKYGISRLNNLIVSTAYLRNASNFNAQQKQNLITTSSIVRKGVEKKLKESQNFAPDILEDFDSIIKLSFQNKSDGELNADLATKFQISVQKAADLRKLVSTFYPTEIIYEDFNAISDAFDDTYSIFRVERIFDKNGNMLPSYGMQTPFFNLHRELRKVRELGQGSVFADSPFLENAGVEFVFKGDYQLPNGKVISHSDMNDMQNASLSIVALFAHMLRDTNFTKAGFDYLVPSDKAKSPLALITRKTGDEYLPTAGGRLNRQKLVDEYTYTVGNYYKRVSQNIVTRWKTRLQTELELSIYRSQIDAALIAMNMSSLNDIKSLHQLQQFFYHAKLPVVFAQQYQTATTEIAENHDWVSTTIVGADGKETKILKLRDDLLAWMDIHGDKGKISKYLKEECRKFIANLTTNEKVGYTNKNATGRNLNFTLPDSVNKITAERFGAKWAKGDVMVEDELNPMLEGYFLHFAMYASNLNNFLQGNMFQYKYKDTGIWYGIKRDNEEYEKAVNEANARPKTTLIPQNLVSGEERYGTTQLASGIVENLMNDVDKITSIDMIERGYRTRTTRTAAEIKKYNIQPGSYTYMFGKAADGTTKRILVKITNITKGINPETWFKEGWSKEGISTLSRYKDPYTIEFEIVSKSSGLELNPYDVVENHMDASYIDFTKRAPMQVTSFYQPILEDPTPEKGTRKLPKVSKIAYFNDTWLNHLNLATGELANKEIYDGAFLQLPIELLKLQHSYGKRYSQLNSNIVKDITVTRNNRSGLFKFEKKATYPITNEMIRLSQGNGKLDMMKVVERMLSSVPFPTGGPVQIDYAPLAGGAEIHGSYSNMWQLFQALGGIDNERVWEDLLEIEYKYPVIANSYIAKIGFSTSVKTGLTSNNGDIESVIHGLSPITIDTVDNTSTGIQLNAQHDVDQVDNSLSMVQQMLAAAVAEGRHMTEAAAIYEAISLISDFKVKKRFEKYDNAEELVAGIMEDYASRNTDRIDNVVGLLTAGIDLNERSLATTAMSQVTSAYSSAAIRHKFDGLQCVLTPVTNIIMVYDIVENGQTITVTRDGLVGRGLDPAQYTPRNLNWLRYKQVTNGQTVFLESTPVYQLLQALSDHKKIFNTHQSNQTQETLQALVDHETKISGLLGGGVVFDRSNIKELTKQTVANLALMLQDNSWTAEPAEVLLPKTFKDLYDLDKNPNVNVNDIISNDLYYLDSLLDEEIIKGKDTSVYMLLQDYITQAKSQNMPIEKYLKAQQNGDDYLKLYHGLVSRSRAKVRGLRANLKGLTARIPGTGKQSYYPFKVVGFLDSMDNAIAVPYQAMTITGEDLDIDKGNVQVRSVIKEGRDKGQVYPYYTTAGKNNPAGRILTLDEIRNHPQFAKDFIMLNQHYNRKDGGWYVSGLQNFIADQIERIHLAGNNVREVNTMVSTDDIASQVPSERDYLYSPTNPMSVFLLNTVNQVGKSMVGIEANGLKAYYALFFAIQSEIDKGMLKIAQTEEETHNSTFPAAFDVRFNGKRYRNLANTTMRNLLMVQLASMPQEHRDTVQAQVNEAVRKNILDKQAGQSYSELINAATDNAKLLYLGRINLNQTTGDMVNAMVIVGIPVEEALSYVKSPVIKNLVDASVSTGKSLRAIVKEYRNRIEKEAKYFSPSDSIEKLENEIASLKGNSPSLSKLLRELDIMTWYNNLSPADSNVFYTLPDVLDMAEKYGRIPRSLGITNGVPTQLYKFYNIVQGLVSEQTPLDIVEKFFTDDHFREQWLADNGDSRLEPLYVIAKNPHYLAYYRHFFKTAQILREQLPLKDLTMRVARSYGELQNFAGMMSYDDMSNLENLVYKFVDDQYLTTLTTESYFGYTFDFSKQEDRVRFVQEFGKLVSELKKKYDGSNNFFVENLIPSTYQDKLSGHKLTIYRSLDTRGLADEQLAVLKASLGYLTPEEQQMFHVYSQLMSSVAPVQTTIARLLAPEVLSRYNQFLKNFIHSITTTSEYNLPSLIDELASTFHTLNTNSYTTVSKELYQMLLQMPPKDIEPKLRRIKIREGRGKYQYYMMESPHKNMDEFDDVEGGIGWYNQLVLDDEMIISPFNYKKSSSGTGGWFNTNFRFGNSQDGFDDTYTDGDDSWSYDERNFRLAGSTTELDERLMAGERTKSKEQLVIETVYKIDQNLKSNKSTVVFVPSGIERPNLIRRLHTTTGMRVLSAVEYTAAGAGNAIVYNAERLTPQERDLALSSTKSVLVYGSNPTFTSDIVKHTLSVNTDQVSNLLGHVSRHKGNRDPIVRKNIKNEGSGRTVAYQQPTRIPDNVGHSVHSTKIFAPAESIADINRRVRYALFQNLTESIVEQENVITKSGIEYTLKSVEKGQTKELSMPFGKITLTGYKTKGTSRSGVETSFFIVEQTPTVEEFLRQADIFIKSAYARGDAATAIKYTKQLEDAFKVLGKDIEYAYAITPDQANYMYSDITFYERPYTNNGATIAKDYQKVLSAASGNVTIHSNRTVPVEKQSDYEGRNIFSAKGINQPLTNQKISHSVKLGLMHGFVQMITDTYPGIEAELITTSQILNNPDMPNTLSSKKGFYHKNKVYINTDKADLDTAIHEFTHVWLKAMKLRDPKLYEALVMNPDLHGDDFYEDIVYDEDNTYEAELHGEEYLATKLSNSITDLTDYTMVGSMAEFHNWVTRQLKNEILPEITGVMSIGQVVQMMEYAGTTNEWFAPLIANHQTAIQEFFGSGSLAEQLAEMKENLIANQVIEKQC